ncbi:MAG: ASKHA domain-containing protein, partial [Planctomycetota bacterium]
GPILMIDIGTNGEIVLAKDGQLWAASTAAGPAFEGARITCGMRATTGAIEKIVFDDDIRRSVIGNAPAAGICGSALIDLAAEMLRYAMITPTGQMLGPDQLPENLPKAIRQRVYENADHQVEFLVSQEKQGRKDLRVVLTQGDIRELQLAVGAIRAGIRIMLKKADIQPKDLKRVLIAGGFGSFIRRRNAQTIGLLPAEIDRQKINYVGNVSLAGAKWTILSANTRKYAEKIARQTEHIELSLDTNFQMEFAEAMIFPVSTTT